MLKVRCAFCKEFVHKKCFPIMHVGKHSIATRMYICKACAGTRSFLYVDKNNVVKYNAVEKLYNSSFLDDFDD